MQEKRDPCNTPQIITKAVRNARENPEEAFTSLALYLTKESLLEGFKKLKKTAAKGLDGVGWNDYSKNLEGNIASSRKRLRDKTYQKH